MIAPDNQFDRFRSAIAAPYPNDFRRRPVQEAPLMEVGVFGDDCEPLGTRCRSHNRVFYSL